MSVPLIITLEAEADLADAKSWYNRQRIGLGEQFILCVEEGFDRIQRLPKAALEIIPGIRRLTVRRFPYGIFYRVDPDQIAVIAVYHSKRDPIGWQTRV